MMEQLVKRLWLQGKIAGLHPSTSLRMTCGAESLDITIFPNPAQNELKLTTKKESEDLYVSIKDLSGRTVLLKTIKSKGFIANLEMELANGAYLIIIVNANNENTTKKLLISK